MNEPIDAQEKFYARWEKRRKKKWLWVFLYGFQFWGLTFLVLQVFIRHHFDISSMNAASLGTGAITWGISGLLWGYWLFKMIDAGYLKYYNITGIEKGIELLKSGKIWVSEDLEISLESDGTLIVKNKLLWYDDMLLSFENANDCLNLVAADFKRLLRNQGFGEFINGKEIKIQLVDNSQKRKIITEMLYKAQ